ncbi:DUF4365 domain-containing protein [Phenylobacterium terrae]|uniref:Phospholipase D n=1 Tax=Phenylobacterium terrae TaxID=2665495 RepID=A0ABW4N7G2_9CAUL
MRFDNTAALADEGVAAIGRLFNRRLRWIFREVAKRDVGIDAQVEVCRDGLVTSRLLALQIKSGSSYFREPLANGWIYRGGPDHLDYFLAHSLPVLLVLYDPEEERAWWQEVTAANARRTEHGWTLHIPRAQEVEPEAADAMDAIAHTVPSGEWSRLPRLKRLSSASTGLAPIYEVLAAARRELQISTSTISPEFVAILDFLSVEISVKLLVAADARSREALKLASPRSRLEVMLTRQPLHAKYLIVDGRVAWMSSGSLTWSLHHNYEVLEPIDGRPRVRALIREFEDVWASSWPLADLEP